jgi:hypothetical protein
MNRRCNRLLEGVRQELREAKVAVKEKTTVAPGMNVEIQANRGMDDFAWKVKVVVDAEISKATVNDIGLIPARIQGACTKFISKANKAASKADLLDLWGDMAKNM